MKPTWRWSHSWKCVSLKMIDIEHIFGFVHVDFYAWNFSFSYYSPQDSHHIFLFHTLYYYLSLCKYLSLYHIIWCISTRSRNRLPLLNLWWSFVHFMKNIVYSLLLYSKKLFRNNLKETIHQKIY